MNETLMTAEETVKAEDMGDYYRIPVDARDLNYDKYFETGDMNVNLDKSFTSDNTTLLTVEEIKEKLLELDYVKEALKK